jgi:hypothetical protein
MDGPWHKVMLLKVYFTSYMLGSFESLISSLEIIAFASLLEFILGLLGSLSRSVEVDVTLEHSLFCSLALSFARCALIVCIYSSKTWFIFFCPCINSVTARVMYELLGWLN